MPDTGLDEGIEMKAEVFLPEDYTPAENEPFMNERQLEYFRRKLVRWRLELLEGSREAIESLQDGTRAIPEVAGEPISLKRLDARPIATMTLEAQERHERREKVHRDD